MNGCDTQILGHRSKGLVELVYIRLQSICDAIWENPLDVAKWHFEKWLETVRKLVYNNIELLNIIQL